MITLSHVFYIEIIYYIIQNVPSVALPSRKWWLNTVKILSHQSQLFSDGVSKLLVHI